jgi:hypothetical protein
MTRPAELAKANVKGKTRRGPERTILEHSTGDAMSECNRQVSRASDMPDDKNHDSQPVTLGLAKESQYSDGTELDWPNGVCSRVLFFCAHLPQKPPAAIVYSRLD